jgi:hypothetical protein
MMRPACYVKLRHYPRELDLRIVPALLISAFFSLRDQTCELI